MHENPTLQKTWRVVVLLAPIFLSLAVTLLVIRLAVTRDSVTKLWPEGANEAVRILKSPSTASLVEEHLDAVALFEGTPWTLGDILSTSKREVAIFLADDHVVGVSLDHALGGEIEGSLAAYNLKVITNGKKHLIVKTDNEPVKLRSFDRFAGKLLLPHLEGEVLRLDAATGRLASFPFRSTEDGLILHGLPKNKTASALTLGIPEDTHALAFLNISREMAEQVLPEDIPLVYPGVDAFMREATKNGLTLFIGQDQIGLMYIFGVEGGKLSTEELESLVKEGIDLPTLTKTVNSEVNELSFEDIRPSTPAIIATSEEKHITLTTARENPNGPVLVRASQTPRTLLLSNRDIYINVPKPIASNTCLKNARAFVRPGELQGLLPASLTIAPQTFTSFFGSVTEIAFAKSKMKICW